MFDFDKYFRTRTSNLKPEFKKEIDSIFKEVCKALENNNVDRVKLLLLDLLILEKQKQQIETQVRKLTKN